MSVIRKQGGDKMTEETEVKKGSINWAVRLKNKQWVTSAVSGLLIFVYQALNLLGIELPIAKEEVFNVVLQLLAFLTLMGIIQDPTTAGIGDSASAQQYTEPKQYDTTT
jgi:phi LC3 family holin